jgi:lactobin A/cerein 7B family class IIb bacteriocin
MSNIKLQDLVSVSNSISGAELFNDSESFIKEMTEDDLVSTHGGGTPVIASGIAAGLLLGALAAYLARKPAPKPLPE